MRVVEARLSEGAGGSGMEQSNSEDKLSRDMLAHYMGVEGVGTAHRRPWPPGGC